MNIGKLNYKTLNKLRMAEVWSKLKALSSDLEWDYWDYEHFIFDLPGKWDLSFSIELEQEIIGYCILSKKENYIWLHHIILSSAYRGKGIANFVLCEIKKRVIEKNENSILRLKVALDNLQASKFYKKNGFCEICTESGYKVLEKKYGTTIAIHQPNYFPWAGYFYKIIASDGLVFLDDVQYTKNSYINRTKIKSAQGESWLTVPAQVHLGQLISEVNPVDNRWVDKHKKTLDGCYSRAPYYKTYRDRIFEVLDAPYESIAEMNSTFIKVIVDILGINTRFFLSSDMKISESSDDRLIEILKKTEADTYLSGTGAINYQSEQKYNNAGINLVYSKFKPIEYNQVWGDFVPGLSILDMLFNCGDETLEILKSSGK